MRILLYNWVPYDDAEKRGGGVRVYQNHLVDFLARHTDDEVTILSSGLNHDVLRRRPRIKQTPNAHGDRVRSFTLMNSPILAPGQHSFGHPGLFDEGDMLDVWHRFLDEQGPFDVIQFDSLEGIPFTFLRVHEHHPDTRVVLYAHNYYAVCPQVNLWKQERMRCESFQGGHDCVSCVPQLANATEVIRAHRLGRLLRRTGVRPGTRLYGMAYKGYAQMKRVWRLLHRSLTRLRVRQADRRGAPNSPATLQPALLSAAQPPPLAGHGGDAQRFAQRRTQAVELISTQVNVVLATSQRVKQVLTSYGIPEQQVAVAYIGTDAASQVDPARQRAVLHEPGQLTLAYLGYLRPDKGFFFLLDALESCPAEVLSRLRLVLAAPAGDEFTMRRLRSLAQSMIDIRYVGGYTHDQLGELLADVDVGVVPVQWDDNLPQVAVEMVAHGVPLITSDRGGAHELGNNPSFVFSATEHDELITIWCRLLDGQLHPGDYWTHASELTTMHQHITQLRRHYTDGQAPGLEPMKIGHAERAQETV